MIDTLDCDGLGHCELRIFVNTIRLYIPHTLGASVGTPTTREGIVRLIAFAALGALAAMAAPPAGAQLSPHKDLSQAAALAIATTAAETCKGQGYRVSVTVVGRNG